MSKRRLTAIETITASLLSAMAIVISYYQYKVANEQTKLIAEQTKLMKLQTDNAITQTEINLKQKSLMEEQNKVARQELKNAEALEEMRRAGEWQELKKTIDDLLMNVYHGGFKGLQKISKEERGKWFLKIQEKLESQSKNVILLQNKTCLNKWRNAIETARMGVRIFDQNETMYINGKPSVGKAFMDLYTETPRDPDTLLDDIFTSFGKGIHRDIVTVWEKAIVNGDSELTKNNLWLQKQNPRQRNLRITNRIDLPD